MGKLTLHDTQGGDEAERFMDAVYAPFLGRVLSTDMRKAMHDALDKYLVELFPAEWAASLTAQPREDHGPHFIHGAPTVAAQQCGLDEKALRCAVNVYNDSLEGKHFGATERIVSAYLSALAPPDVAGLVERLAEWRNNALVAGEADMMDVCDKSASTLTHLAAENALLREREGWKLKLGDRVTKLKGSSWTGCVVGFYSTALTPVGYAVESETETGSVQIYPEAALAASPSHQEQNNG